MISCGQAISLTDHVRVVGGAEPTQEPVAARQKVGLVPEDRLTLLLNAARAAVAAGQEAAVLRAEIRRAPLVGAGVQGADAAARDQQVELIAARRRRC